MLSSRNLEVLITELRHLRSISVSSPVQLDLILGAELICTSYTLRNQETREEEYYIILPVSSADIELPSDHRVSLCVLFGTSDSRTIS